MPRIIQSRIAVPGPAGSGSNAIDIYDGGGGYVGPATRLDMGTGLSADDIGGATRKKLSVVFGTAAGTAAQGSWAVDLVLSSDVPTTSTSNVPVTALGLSMGANEKWVFDFYLMAGCSGSGGSQYSVTAPGSGQSFTAMLTGSKSSTTIRFAKLTTTGVLTTETFNNTTDGWVEVHGTTTTSSGGGSISFSLASGSSANTSTVYAGSRVTARRIV